MTAQIPSGFIAETHSATAAVLQKGKQLNDAGGLKALLAHTVIPVSAFVTAALDTVAHAFGTLLDGSLLILKSPVWLATIGNIDMAPGATFSTVGQHTARTAGNLAMTVAIPLTSCFSCDAALAILDRTKVAPGASQDQTQVSVWTSIGAQKDLKTKTVYAWDHKSEVAKAILTLTKQVGNSGLDLADQYKKHAAYAAGGATVLFSLHQSWYGLVQKEEVMLGKAFNSVLGSIGLGRPSEQTEQQDVKTEIKIEQQDIKAQQQDIKADQQNVQNEQTQSRTVSASPTPPPSQTISRSPTPTASQTITSSPTPTPSQTATASSSAQPPAEDGGSGFDPEYNPETDKWGDLIDKGLTNGGLRQFTNDYVPWLSPYLFSQQDA